MKMTTNSIGENIDRWLFRNLPSFEFRPNQKETIVKVISKVLSSEDMIVEAPTGTGKSIISIIAAGVLADFYNLRSYILCSDLYLWKQYDDFIKENCLSNFGSLKGQTGNYHCQVNDEDLRNAECRMAAINWMDLFNSKTANRIGFSCAKTCPYVKERKKAVNSKVILMTYQLFIYQFNRTQNTSFKRPDVIFCDECHNIPSIVQEQCSPVIRKFDFDMMARIWEYFDEKTKNNERDLFTEDDDINYNILLESFSSKKKLLSSLNDAYDEMLTCSNNNKDLLKSVLKFDSIVEKFFKPCTEIEEALSEKFRMTRKFSKNEKSLYKCLSFYKNYMCFWHDFITAVRDTNSKFVREIGQDSSFTDYITFKCIREDIMCSKYLLSISERSRIFLSATVGNEKSFKENIGEDNPCEMTRVPSIFNFDRSPIYVLGRYKINYSNSFEVFKKLVPNVQELCERHSNERGIIHTASYSNAQTLYKSSSEELQKRMIVYSNSGEKKRALEKFQKIKNAIIVGPSLCEGIDLPDDLCRFIIIMKVPFQSLGSEFVREKMQVFKDWYQSTASNMIIQGIGRGVRNDNDWCVTYILDGCFVDLYRRTISQYSDESKQRVKIYN